MAVFTRNTAIRTLYERFPLAVDKIHGFMQPAGGFRPPNSGRWTTATVGGGGEWEGGLALRLAATDWAGSVSQMADPISRRCPTVEKCDFKRLNAF